MGGVTQGSNPRLQHWQVDSLALGIYDVTLSLKDSFLTKRHKKHILETCTKAEHPDMRGTHHGLLAAPQSSWTPDGVQGGLKSSGDTNL